MSGVAEHTLPSGRCRRSVNGAAAVDAYGPDDGEFVEITHHVFSVFSCRIYMCLADPGGHAHAWPCQLMFPPFGRG